MLYEIKSDTLANHDNGMCAPAYCYNIEAMSEIDAVIKASKNAEEDEEYICCDDTESGMIVCAYRIEDGTYEFHVYDGNNDIAFTI